MFTLSKVKLPSTIIVGGNSYQIKTDFRFWIMFAELLEDKKTTLGDLDFIYEDIKPFNRISGYNELLRFYNPSRPLPRATGNKNNQKILDYRYDAELIYSAFYEVYHIDLLDEHLRLHWHKFLVLLSGLHGTKLNDVMSYRSYNANDKTKYETHMNNLKKAWQLPQDMELTEETKKFNSLFEKK